MSAGYHATFFPLIASTSFLFPFGSSFWYFMNCENISVSSCNNPFNDVIGTMSIYEQYKSSYYISLNNVNYENVY